MSERDDEQQQNEDEKQLPFEGEHAGGGDDDGPQPWAKTSSGDADEP